MFRGTFHMVLLPVEFYSKRVNKESDVEKYETILREELLELCDTLHDSATEMVEKLSPN